MVSGGQSLWRRTRAKARTEYTEAGAELHQEIVHFSVSSENAP